VPNRRARPTPRLNDEPPLHVPAALVDGEAAVEAELTGSVGAEVERDRLPGLGALHDPVMAALGVFDGEAVRDVFGREVDVYQVVLRHSNFGRVAAGDAVGVLAGDDLEFPPPLLGDDRTGHRDRQAGEGGQQGARETTTA
jgi:hypothetical protein